MGRRPLVNNTLQIERKMTRGNIGELVIGMEKWNRGVSSGGWNFIPSEPYTRKPTKNPKGGGGGAKNL